VREGDGEPGDAEEASEAEASCENGTSGESEADGEGEAGGENEASGEVLVGGEDEADRNKAGENEAGEGEAGEHEADEDEASGDEVDGDEAGGDEVKKHTTAKVFPVAVHKCGDHKHTHSHAKQRIFRVPDGRQLFSVVLKVHLNDPLIDYSRTLASMSSVTENVDNSTGLDDHDFKHLCRLIEIRFIDLVAGVDLVEKRMPIKDLRLLHRFTVELDLVTGEDPKRDMGKKTFLNFGTGLIAAEEAKDITAKLEEVILDAIEAVDGLAAWREIARSDPKHCPCSAIWILKFVGPLRKNNSVSGELLCSNRTFTAWLLKWVLLRGLLKVLLSQGPLSPLLPFQIKHIILHQVILRFLDSESASRPLLL
jgi:hypothetical protein